MNPLPQPTSAQPCACMRTSAPLAEAVDALSAIRSSCPALRYVYLPNGTWQEFLDWHAAPLDNEYATHHSKILLALTKGCLGKLTGPIHRFLLQGGELRSDVGKNYLQELRERWMLQSDNLRRHRLSKRHARKVAELQVAEWLETIRGYQDINLEALGAGADIEATSPETGPTAFEVKAFGVDDSDYQLTTYQYGTRPNRRSLSRA